MRHARFSGERETRKKNLERERERESASFGGTFSRGRPSESRGGPEEVGDVAQRVVAAARRGRARVRTLQVLGRVERDRRQRGARPAARALRKAPEVQRAHFRERQPLPAAARENSLPRGVSRREERERERERARRVRGAALSDVPLRGSLARQSLRKETWSGRDRSARGSLRPQNSVVGLLLRQHKGAYFLRRRIIKRPKTAVACPATASGVLRARLVFFNSTQNSRSLCFQSG